MNAKKVLIHYIVYSLICAGFLSYSYVTYIKENSPDFLMVKSYFDQMKAQEKGYRDGYCALNNDPPTCEKMADKYILEVMQHQ